MKKQPTLTQNDFDALLDWLAADREDAGGKYEAVRNGLIKFFRFRGSSDAETLADETINRVARKIHAFDLTKNVKPITYFYGFASKIWLEHLRTVKNREVSLETGILAEQKVGSTDTSASDESNCLESCLAKLPREDSVLIVEYYGKEKGEKFEQRRQLAEAVNLKMPALHTRVFRIRQILRDCVEKCVGKNNL